MTADNHERCDIQISSGRTIKLVPEANAEHLPETEEWEEVGDEELTQAYDDILKLWNSVKDGFLDYEANESQLENQFIRPLFEKLGIPYVVEESAKKPQTGTYF